MPLETVDILKKYPNRVFVETGTYKGDGIQTALNAGFERTHSMEIFLPLYYQSSKRFANNYNVKIWFGDTSKNFADMISGIDEKVTFWLDSHVSGRDSGYNPQCPHPLVDELKVIAAHPIKTHTILMDDRRFFKEWGCPDDMLKEIIKAINPKYQFRYEDGYQKDDIMVAFIPSDKD